MVSVEMRHQPFALWIKDLSAPDPLTPVNLFGLLDFTPPSFLLIGILPILLGVTMWLQFKLNPQQMDPVQQQIFSFMPWVMMVILAPFAAGLVLYWVTSNILTIAQQWWLYRRFGLHLQRHPPGHHLSGAGSRPGGARPQAVRRADRVPEVGAGAQVPARPDGAGDRLCRALERRQELAAQRAHQPQVAGAHLQHAGPDAGAQLLRRRPAAAAAAGRHARLRLCRRAQGSGQALALPGQRLPARPGGAQAGAGADRFAPRPEAGRP